MLRCNKCDISIVIGWPRDQICYFEKGPVKIYLVPRPILGKVSKKVFALFLVESLRLLFLFWKTVFALFLVEKILGPWFKKFCIEKKSSPPCRWSFLSFVDLIKKYCFCGKIKPNPNYFQTLKWMIRTIEMNSNSLWVFSMKKRVGVFLEVGRKLEFKNSRMILLISSTFIFSYKLLLYWSCEWAWNSRTFFFTNNQIKKDNSHL